MCPEYDVEEEDEVNRLEADSLVFTTYSQGEVEYRVDVSADIIVDEFQAICVRNMCSYSLERISNFGWSNHSSDLMGLPATQTMLMQ